MEDKPINWIGTSKDELVSFPEDARRKAGFQLRRVQRGEAPVDFKPISTIGKGVRLFTSWYANHRLNHSKPCWKAKNSL
jgi:phage-related protein